MGYKYFDAEDQVLQKGQEDYCFYLILFGRTNELVKNPAINNWDWAMTVYQALQRWKKQEFDPKAEAAYMIH